MNQDHDFPQIYEFGEFRIDIAASTLHRNGHKLGINRRTFGVLRLLVENAGKIVTKQEFFDTVWADTFVEDNSLTVAMTSLRRLLGDDPKQPIFVENLPRIGYRFIAEVVTVNPNSNLGPRTAPVVIDKPRGRVRRRTIAGAAVAVLLLGLGVFALVAGKGWLFRTTVVRSPIRSVAVLPFENSDPNTQYLSDGLTDTLITSLAEIPNLRTINRNSVFEFMRKEKVYQNVERDLGVEALVTGRIVQNRNELVIRAKLTDAVNGRELWSKQYEGQNPDLSLLRRSLLQDLSEALNSTLTEPDKQRLTKPDTKVPEAYENYLKGLYFWNRRTVADFAKGADYFRAATAADPTFAKAYLGLANCYASGSFDFIRSDGERARIVIAGSKQALDIDPTLGGPYATQALMKTYYRWDWADAENDYKLAIEREPNFATAHHWYAEFLTMQGRFDESFAEYERALELDPLSMAIRTDLGLAYYYAGQFDRAVNYLQQSKDLDITYPRTYLYLSEVYRNQGKYDEAIDEYEKYRVRVGDDLQELTKKIDLFRNELKKLGPKGFWQFMLRDSLSQNSPGFDDAMYYTKLGEKEKAFELLEKAYSRRQVSLVNLRIKREFDDIRTDPRFVDLIRRVGLE